MQIVARAQAWAGRHWFFGAFAAMLAGIYLLSRWPQFIAEGGEIALLTDLCVTAPLLYWLCYRRSVPARRLVVRALALACASVWLAGHLVPAGAQALLPRLEWVRTLGLAVVILVELRIVIAVLRLAASQSASAEQLSQLGDVPPFIARLMLAEARMWRGIWSWLRGRH